MKIPTESDEEDNLLTQQDLEELLNSLDHEINLGRNNGYAKRDLIDNDHLNKSDKKEPEIQTEKSWWFW